MKYLSRKSSVEVQEPPFSRKIKNSGWHGCCALSLFGCFHVNRRPASFKPRRPPRRKSYDQSRKSRTDPGARHGYRTEVPSSLSSSRECHNEHPTHGIELIRNCPKSLGRPYNVALRDTEMVLFGPFWGSYTGQIYGRNPAPTPFRTVS